MQTGEEPTTPIHWHVLQKYLIALLARMELMVLLSYLLLMLFVNKSNLYALVKSQLDQSGLTSAVGVFKLKGTTVVTLKPMSPVKAEEAAVPK